ncbi:MAG: hypothetical protein H7Y08_08355, partial [Rhizobiaceae bacterium]|nr:hypothetical protein [Rhizobiaceae bacterium]
MKAEAGAAQEAAKNDGADFAASVKDRVFKEAEHGKETVSSGLEDFAAAIRKASEELGNRDQSMASTLVREVASGLERATGSIKGKSVQELTQSVTGFARRQPTAFLVGAALAGIALGRFARASGEGHGEATQPRGPSNQGAARSREPARSHSSWEEDGSAPFPSTSTSTS